MPPNARTAHLRNATLGGGLILNRIAEGGLVLHAMTDNGPRELGCFDDVVDAWKAIDTVDQERDAVTRAA
jgi:hypothetical protein